MTFKLFPITLGIDYGTERLGLAINHGSLAEPFKILVNDELMFGHLKNILGEQKIEQIVVGMSENKMAKKTQHFVSQLKKITHSPITFIDETLSSVLVKQKLIEAGVKLSKRRGPIDHYAATLILQDWLDEHADENISSF